MLKCAEFFSQRSLCICTSNFSPYRLCYDRRCRTTT